MFIINGIEWHIEQVNPDSTMLVRSDGSRTVGMTDGDTHTVFIDNTISDIFYKRVLCHEIVHCICFSYDIHIPIEQEELIAEWVSEYGRECIDILDKLLSKKG